MNDFVVISSYTDEDAIEDGVLVRPFPEKAPKILFTAAVHAAIEAVNDGRTYAQKAIPLILDAARIVGRRVNDRLWTEGLEGNVTGQDLWIGRNGLGGLTLMFPSDY